MESGVPGSGTRQQEFGLAGVSAELPQGAGLDLAHPLLRDPQLGADLPQRPLAPAADPEPADQHPPLPLVELTQQPRHDLLPPVPGAPLLTRVGAGVDGVPVDRPTLEGGPFTKAAAFAECPDQV